jgi:hypothetical protein
MVEQQVRTMTGPPAGHAGRRSAEPVPGNGGSREELHGRAAGVTVCAVMGSTWAASALGPLNPVVTMPVLIVTVAVLVSLLRGARRLRRSAATVPSGVAGVDLGQVRRRFTVVVAAEFVAIAAAVNILGRTGHSRWLPAVICAVVGLHFVPLAHLFRVRLYYATAAALCLVATFTMVLGATTGRASLWQLVPGFGTALALWVTGARLVTAIPRRG